MSDEQTKENPEASAPVEGQAANEAAPLKGIIGTKIGMTRIFTDESKMVPVTVIASDGVVVTQIKTAESDGYTSVQIGYGDIKEKNISGPEKQHLSKKSLPLKRWLREFRVKDPAPFKLGQPVPATVFQKGEWIQVSGYTKGHGYAGVVKRHGFAGLPHSHGNGEYRNRPGSSGAQGHQHVIPGTKKPGHFGHIWSTVPKIQVVDVDAEKNLILLKGSIPGPNGNFVVLRPTSRKVKAGAAQAAAKKKAKK
jgi:large subunit ribosomal protein L3